MGPHGKAKGGLPKSHKIEGTIDENRHSNYVLGWTDSFKKDRSCKLRTTSVATSDILLEKGKTTLISSKLFLKTTWVDPKFAEKRVSEVLFCI